MFCCTWVNYLLKFQRELLRQLCSINFIYLSVVCMRHALSTKFSDCKRGGGYCARQWSNSCNYCHLRWHSIYRYILLPICLKCFFFSVAKTVHSCKHLSFVPCERQQFMGSKVVLKLDTVAISMLCIKDIVVIDRQQQNESYAKPVFLHSSMDFLVIGI